MTRFLYVLRPGLFAAALVMSCAPGRVQVHPKDGGDGDGQSGGGGQGANAGGPGGDGSGGSSGAGGASGGPGTLGGSREPTPDGPPDPPPAFVPDAAVDTPCDCANPTPACADYCGARDAAVDWPPPPPGCTCVPGQSRWCHVSPSCEWGQQQCSVLGGWGECKSHEPPAACSGYDTRYGYNFCCCFQAGLCCDNDEDGAHKGGTGTSAGKCDGITCATDKPSTYPPKSTCPGKGDCVPGGERYCGGALLGGSMSKQVCQADGSWGPCNLSAGSVCGGAFGFQECCVENALCCRRERYCNDGTSFGNCDGIACK